MNFEDFIKNEMTKPYFSKIKEVLKNNNYFPKEEDIFNAFKMCPLEKVKVVIFGQDPYHEENQAHGLAFSCLSGRPKSLINIFKEIKSDTGHDRKNTDLSDLAYQGVLLLNTVLTCEKHKANSHKNIGWEEFTNNVISLLNKENRKIVYILFGNNAKEKKKLISNNSYIIETAHPSPLSANRGFFGSKPFSKCNEYLIKEGMEPIKWWD